LHCSKVTNGKNWGDDSLHPLTGGGYVISPVNRGKQSVVKHMLAIDWKFWKSYLQPSSARSITINMLGRVAGSLQLDGTSYVCFISMIISYNMIFLILFLLYAALREMFRAKLGNYTSPDFSSGELIRNIRLNQTEGASTVDFRILTGDGRTKENITKEMEKTPSEHGSLVSLTDAADEFFDVPEPSYYDQSENSLNPDFGSDMYSQVQYDFWYSLLTKFLL
jgi:hypothetical protein